MRLITAPDLKAFSLGVDVLVYASGAEAILKDLPAGRQAIEFRYVPDPHAIRQTLHSGTRALAHGIRHSRGKAFMKISEMNWLQVEAIPEVG